MHIYGLIGYPIIHSLSPVIWRLFARQCHERLDYQLWPAQAGQFNIILRELQAKNVRGFNVTAPLKQEAYLGVSRLSARAVRAGAVNTVSILADGTTHGDNTDGIGLLEDIGRRLGFDVSGRRVALIGAGGAARGIVPALLDAAVAEIVVFNRTRTHAEALAAQFPERVCVGAAEVDRQHVDLILNSVSTLAVVPLLQAIVPKSGALAVDLVYDRGVTPFMDWAKQAGVQWVSDGLGMLVAQAAESYRVLRGVRPEIAPVLAEIYAKLK